MAIFHASINIISRSAGHSALAAAAYRAAEDIGPHKYAKRGGVRDTEIMYPADAPDWVKAMGRAELWQSVEDVEKRRDAQLARSGDFALPRELSWPQRRELVRGFVAEYYCGRGMVVDVAYHDGRNGENPHWHPMAPMRRAEAEGWGKKAREWNDKAWLQAVRQGWAEHVNAALERAGVDARIDHRTLAEQGIDRTPQQHKGRYWSSLEKLERALETKIADEERRLESLENQIRQMQEDKDNEQEEIRDDAGAAPQPDERLVAEEKWQQAQATAPPPADLDEAMRRARRAASITYHADMARRGEPAAPVGTAKENAILEAAADAAAEAWFAARRQAQPLTPTPARHTEPERPRRSTATTEPTRQQPQQAQPSAYKADGMTLEERRRAEHAATLAAAGLDKRKPAPAPATKERGGRGG